MIHAEQPVVVFDSGVGGISVLRALVRELPQEHFVYYGDSANAPYGVRTTEEIRALTLEKLRLLDELCQFKAAVIACNTATSAAINPLREVYRDRPVIGIEPALKLGAERNPGKTVAVLATQTTLREKKFAALIARYAGSCRVVSLPCPELVEFVERGEVEGSAVEDYLSRRLGPWLNGELGAVVLGCTHFPFVKSALRRILPPRTELLDGSDGTARQTRRLLDSRGLLRSSGEGSVTLLNSDPNPDRLALSRKLLYGDP